MTPHLKGSRSLTLTGRRTTQWVLAVLVALVMIAPTRAEAADGADRSTGWVRAGHLAVGQGAADITLTPFTGGEPVVVPDVSFGDVTDFASVPSGLYTVTVVPTGAGPDATPMISASVRVEPDRARTVLAIGEKGDVEAQVLDDDLRAPSPGQAKVRLVSAATGSESVDVSVVDGPVLARDVALGGSTGYAEVGSQTWSIRTSATDGSRTTTSRVPVEAGGVYTLFVVGEAGDLRLEAVEDASGSSTMPRGGVDTGGGGLAAASGAGDHGGSTGVLLAGLLGLAVLIGLVRPRPAVPER